MKNIDGEFLVNTYKKLLINNEKTKSLLDFLEGKKRFDELMPISIELHLTNRCNLNCEWCVDKQIRKSKDSLKLDTLQAFVEDIAWKNIGLTIEGGGEPTLYEKFNEFVLLCYRNGIKLGLITNGVKILPIEILKCFDWIRVSLDSTNREEYIKEKGVDCFETVVSNIKRIAREAPEVILSIGYVITTRNCENISKLFSLFEDVKIDHFRIRTVEEYDKYMISQKKAEELSRIINDVAKRKHANVLLSLVRQEENDNKGLPCIAHSLRAIIHADGNVLVCEKRRHDIMILGNINKDKFSKIWLNKKHCEMAKKLSKPESQKGCTVCRITKYNEIITELQKMSTTNFI